MKLTTLLAAGLMAATVGAPGVASAQVYGGHGHYDRDYREYRGDRHDRYDRRDYGYRHGGYRHGPRCWTEWRHHHRVRICR